MKHIIISLLFFIGIMPSGVSQNIDLNVFKITNSQLNTGTYGKSYYFQTCVNNDGLIIMFNGPELLLALSKQMQLARFGELFHQTSIPLR